MNIPICPNCGLDRFRGHDDNPDMYACTQCGWKGMYPDWIDIDDEMSPEEAFHDKRQEDWERDLYRRMDEEDRAEYDEERDEHCPYCGRRRDIPENRGGRIIMRCAFCDFGSVNVTEDDDDYTEDDG